jgi:uncharacterized integral membrane protein
LFLVAFAGVTTAFAFQNLHDVTVTFFNWSFKGPVALIIGVSFGLGMLSGWSIVGMLRRSLSRVTEGPAQRQ